MAIRGDLLSVDLSNVFQMLAMNRKRGVLRVQNRENILEKRALVLDADRVGLLDIPSRGDLTALLVDEGAIDHDTYSQARRKSKQFGVDAMTYLRKQATISEEMIERVTRRLHEELILEIFLWKNVSFSLDEEQFPRDDDSRRFFNLDLLVMEAARRQDEWLRIIEVIGGGRDIWRACEGQGELSDVERIVYDNLDGVRGTAEIMAETGLPRYHVDLSIGRLHELKLAARLDLEDLIDRGDQLLDEGRTEDAIRLFKCAVRYDRRSIALHKRLAHAFLRQGRVAKAAAHYKFCAMTLLDNGLIRESLAIYEYVVQLLPTDFKALEQVLSLLAQLDEPLTNDDENCLGLGLKLCNFYYDCKRFKDAERVLLHLMAVAPEDTGLGFILARIQSKTGRIADAVETYMKLAGRLHDQGDLQGALNAYKLVVSFDTASKQICLQRIDQILQIMTQKRRRRRFGVAAFSFLGIAAIGLVSYLWYHSKAEAEIDVVLAAEHNVVTEDAWMGIAERYRDFQARYPFTAASRQAGERIGRAEFKISEIRLGQRQAREREAARQSQLIERAEQEVARAANLLEYRDLKASLTAYAEALRLAKEAGQQNWAGHPSRRIPERMAEIEAHLAEEEKNLREVEEALARGERLRAFEVARRLVRPSGDALDAGAVDVVSRQSMARIVVPFDVIARPATTLIDDGSGQASSGRLELELDQTRRKANLAFEAPGHRPARLGLDWESSAFEHHVVLERQESSSLALGDRIVSLRLVGDALAAVCGNGAVYLLEGNAEPRRLAPQGFRTPSTAPVVFSGRIAYGTSDGILLVFDREAEGQREVWSTHPSIDAIAALVSFDDLLVVATDDGKPQLRLYAQADGADQGRIALPAPARELGRDGSRLVALLENGALAFVDMVTKKVDLCEDNRFVGRPAVFAGGVWCADAERRLQRIDAGGFVNSVTDQRVVDGASPTLVDGKLVTALTDGFLFVVDGRSKSRLLRALPVPLAAQMTGRLEDGGDGHVLVELRDSRFIAVDLKSGEIDEAFRSSRGCSAQTILWRDRLVLGCADDSGTLETYRR